MDLRLRPRDEKIAELEKRSSELEDSNSFLRGQHAILAVRDAVTMCGQNAVMEIFHKSVFWRQQYKQLKYPAQLLGSIDKLQVEQEPDADEKEFLECYQEFVIKYSADTSIAPNLRDLKSHRNMVAHPTMPKDDMLNNIKYLPDRFQALVPFTMALISKHWK
ncbi:hypothetical protein MP228_002187 [Amoeboaphelidium protococcarum]|nr:hypothetical protein MP228_002187 [Amoeboaphelidium protococcarum]